MKTEIIIYEVLKHCNISVDDLKSLDRRQHLVKPRYLICYFLRKYTDLSLLQIGEEISKSHATVLHGIVSIANMIETDRKRRDEILGLQRVIEMEINISECDYSDIFEFQMNDFYN